MSGNYTVLDLGIKQYNRKATAQKAEQFLEGKFQSYLHMAHRSYIDIKSPVVSGMPGGGTRFNSMDEKFADHVNAGIAVDNVLSAVESMDQPFRAIIEGRYVKNQTWMQIADNDEVIHSERHCQRLLETALVWFAEAYVSIEDMRVYI